MTTVKVSPKYQIVIPKQVRVSADIQPGQRLAIFRIGNVIELTPVKNVKQMRGSLPGLSTRVDRSGGDRA